MKQGREVGLSTVDSIAEGADLDEKAFDGLKAKLLEGLATMDLTDEERKEYEQFIKETTFKQF